MKRYLILIILALSTIFYLVNNTDKIKIDFEEEIKEPNIKFGFDLDSFSIKNGTIKEGQVLGEILYLHHIDHNQINRIVKKSKDIFDFRRAVPGKKYTVLCSKDTSETAQVFIYEKSLAEYVVFDIRNDIKVYIGKKPIEIKNRLSSGIIESSLWNALVNNNLSPALVVELEAIYAWTLDFFKIQKGDCFTVLFEEKYVEGEFIGIGDVKASSFTHSGNNFYAFYFEENELYGDFFDHEGNNLRKTFLRAPIKYSRISSRFSKRRKHPVTGHWKGHFGTDYAAPTGTPIMATANGTISRASYSRNNGNYVKIKHNTKYSTQYLHMSKIASGIKKGEFVKQGDVIGYVGSTGLATGPHVCYRFWKNGRQVDPYKEKLPAGEPIKKENKENYMLLKDSLLQLLQSETLYDL